MLQANSLQIAGPLGGSEARRTGPAPRIIFPCHPLVTSLRRHPLLSNPHQSLSSIPSSGADRRCAGRRAQGPVKEPLISSVWTRLGPSEDVRRFFLLHTTLLRFKRHPSHCIFARPLRLEPAMPQTASALECNHVTRALSPSLSTTSWTGIPSS